MVMVCRKNPLHKPLGPDRCKVPGCGGRLMELSDEEAALRGLTTARELDEVSSEEREAQHAKAEAEKAEGEAQDALARAEAADREAREDLERVDRTRDALEPPPHREGLIERVEDAVESGVDALRRRIEDLVGQARAHETAARQAADGAAAQARSASEAAAEAQAKGAQNTGDPKFAEAARHAQGAQYHAEAVKSAADEAAHHADAASQQRATVETLASGAAGQTEPNLLQRLVGDIESEVARVEESAANAKAAFAKATASGGEVSRIVDFFKEAFALWQSLHGKI